MKCYINTNTFRVFSFLLLVEHLLKLKTGRKTGWLGLTHRHSSAAPPVSAPVSRSSMKWTCEIKLLFLHFFCNITYNHKHTLIDLQVSLTKYLQLMHKGQTKWDNIKTNILKHIMLNITNFYSLYESVTFDFLLLCYHSVDARGNTALLRYFYLRYRIKIPEKWAAVWFSKSIL